MENEAKAPKVKKTDNMQEYRKTYYEKNKAKYAEHYNRRVLCECGAMVAIMNKSHHSTSKIHERGMKAKKVEPAKDINSEIEAMKKKIDDMMETLKTMKEKKRKINEETEENKNEETGENEKYKDLVYWETDHGGRTCSFYRNGILTREEYDRVNKLDRNFNICFSKISKCCYEEAKLHELTFHNNVNEEIYDRGKYSHNSVDLIKLICDQVGKENLIWNILQGK